MGKVANRVACYWWWSVSKEKRVSWNFPSRKAANDWRDYECRFYVPFDSVESFVAHQTARMGWNKEVSIQRWKIHRDRYIDYKLMRGVFLPFPEQHWHYEKQRFKADVDKRRRSKVGDAEEGKEKE